MTDQSPALRRGRKFDQVLEGARQVFLSTGFEAANMDEVAKASGVSKATLYSYFPDKSQLFINVVQSECARQADKALELIDQSAPPRQVLTNAGNHMVSFLTSEFGQRMFRICVGEADRFPQLGRAFYNNGPLVVRARLCEYLGAARDRGQLHIDDIELAADQFAELCKADLFPRIVFGVGTRFTPAEITRVVDGAVATFMARYGV
ncbi:MAG: TetR/AcrR family transcriptional regulator [Pseudomonadota bacterium]